MSRPCRKSDLLHLFYRIGEPLYYPKGDDDNICYFDLSPDYLPDKYKDKASKLLNRFSDATDGCRVDLGSMLTDALMRINLDDVMSIDRSDRFSVFLPRHQKIAGQLIGIFRNLKNFNELLAFAAYARDRVNPELFTYALATAMLHRKDTEDMLIPSQVQMYPHMFVDSATVADARESAQIYESASDRRPIEVRGYAPSTDSPEQRLAYFREDLGINLHHWHWHLIHPFEGPEAVVAKDRRGELFYYMHHQIMARYNIERLCNRLQITRRFVDWDEPIPEGYFPNLNKEVAGREYPGRPANSRLSDIDRPDANLAFDIEDLRRFKERIYDAIHKKQVISDSGQTIDLNNDRGIDVLGNIVEASILTPNTEYYGSLHNMGHLALGYIHDPRNEFSQPPGVMANNATAMRDPIFYRWHAFVDDIFIDHKNTLGPYDEKTLLFKGIQVRSVELCSLDRNKECKQKNILNTYMMKSDVNLSRGLDFAPHGAVLVRTLHLNHDKFRYTIQVTNSRSRKVLGTVRIFICPVKGYSNYTMELGEQRHLMTEMDKFVAILEPGDNTVVRESSASSVIIPMNQVFRDLNQNRPSESDTSAFDAFNFCGCGWPENMLVPKGTPEGYPMKLFVMISDYELDKVNTSESREESQQQTCKVGISFCGLKNKKYPDKRPMGFPFDKPMPENDTTLESFLTTNMGITSITVKFSENIREGRRG